MKPLEGIKVVEFATYVVVPLAARVMADWGADVIKIEAASGDEWRTNGAGSNLPIDDDCNPSYSFTNSGKKFLSLNLKAPEGKEVILKLLKDADIFVTNVRWASIQRLGLDYDTLHEMFPHLIYFHFNGFGYEGEYKDRPGFDSAGFWSMSGALRDIPEAGAHPMYPPSGFGDAITSHTALSGIMAALFHRTRTGQGMRLTTSLLASGIWCNFNHIIGGQERSDDRVPPVLPRHWTDTTSAMSNIYQCKDGRWMLLATVWTKLHTCMKALGLGEYTTDPRFATREATAQNSVALRDLFVEAFKAKTAAEWDPILTEADSVHQELLASADVSKLQQAWDNDYLTKAMFPNGQEYIMPNSPVTFFDYEHAHTQPVGGVGCHTSEVLSDLGYTAEQIQNLKDSGVAAGK